MHITWLGHSSFLLQLADGQNLLLDPWLDGNPSAPKDFVVPPVSAILVSHGHGDHIGDVIPFAKRDNAMVVCNYEISLWLQSKGVERVSSMNKGGSVQVAGVTVTMTHAFHSSSMLDGDKVVYGGEPAGFVLTLPDGRSVYFAGDTAVFGDMALIARLYQPTLAFLPIGDLYTMGPKEAALAVELLGVKQVIPMHFGTFPPLSGTSAGLRALLAGKDVTVLDLSPGTPISF
ncbi:MAG: metal-dependent hydrolase [Bryobacterales bacterium]|jgi:L-ascorbate metabolism protein UlaG (beta-lactamase superfamily)|nr:metal-dependent hydrolase [Bryobacterales bacterium]